MDLEYYAQRINELVWTSEDLRAEYLDRLVDEYATDFNLDYETARMELSDLNSEIGRAHV